MSNITNSSEVVKKPKSDTKAEKKWGKEVINNGFCMIPSLLLQAQKRLGLNPTSNSIATRRLLVGGG